MKNLKYLIALFFVSQVTLSCESILEPRLDNSLPDSLAWFGPFNRALGFLNNAYTAIPDRFDNYDGNTHLDVATDNALANEYNLNTMKYNYGTMSSLNLLGIGRWNTAYTSLYYVNLFLEKGLGKDVIYDTPIDAPKGETVAQAKARLEVDSLIKVKFKGEALFLRAWWHFQLLQEFGGKSTTGSALGIPLVLKAVPADKAKDNFSERRNTYDECVSRIVKDLDSAAILLRESYSGVDINFGANQIGRATKLSCYGLKSRVLLYSASPAYQSSGVVELSGNGSFTVVNQTQYIEKWTNVAIAMSENLIKLGGLASQNTSLKAVDFNATASPKEFLFRKYQSNRDIENKNYPPSLGGRSLNQPTQNLVEAFPMKNGYPISRIESKFNANTPYLGRDTRLDNTVFYNTAKVGNSLPLEIFVGGRDFYPKSTIATETGYYLRKWLSVKTNLTNPEQASNDNHYHVLLRRTEVLLNYAEALNEAFGPTDKGTASNSAFEVMKQIRTNAGITSPDPYLTEISTKGKEEFRAFIQNERRIELAFENHRFFDLRRNLLKLDNEINTITATRIATPRPPKNGIAQSDSISYTYTTKVFQKRNSLNNSKFYYLPLPYAEITKNPSLINNFGW